MAKAVVVEFLGRRCEAIGCAEDVSRSGRSISVLDELKVPNVYLLDSGP
jgi:hypothetical protein